MENNSTAATEKHKTITIERTFELPLDTIWRAWSEPETFKKWWGPKEYNCGHCTIDFRVGGTCVASMVGKEGIEMWSTGTYREIVPKEKIVVTDNFADKDGNVVPPSYYNIPGDWSDDLLITVEFKEVGRVRTSMLLQHTGLPESGANDCEKGWQSSFDKMEENIR